MVLPSESVYRNKDWRASLHAGGVCVQRRLSRILPERKSEKDRYLPEKIIIKKKNIHVQYKRKRGLSVSYTKCGVTLEKTDNIIVYVIEQVWNIDTILNEFKLVWLQHLNTQGILQKLLHQ